MLMGGTGTYIELYSGIRKSVKSYDCQEVTISEDGTDKDIIKKIGREKKMTKSLRKVL